MACFWAWTIMTFILPRNNTICHGMVLKTTTPSSQTTAKAPVMTSSDMNHLSSSSSTTQAANLPETSIIPSRSTLTKDQYQQDFFIPSNQLSQPVWQLGSSSSSSSKSKSLNAFGLWCAAMCLLTGIPWTAAMTLVDTLVTNDDTKQLFDRTGRIWARAWLTLTNSMPHMEGLEHLEMSNQVPCLLVANHASWMDIPVLCAALQDTPPVFKFIAKRELTKVPGVGQQLVGVRCVLRNKHTNNYQRFSHILFLSFMLFVLSLYFYNYIPHIASSFVFFTGQPHFD